MKYDGLARTVDREAPIAQDAALQRGEEEQIDGDADQEDHESYAVCPTPTSRPRNTMGGSTDHKNTCHGVVATLQGYGAAGGEGSRGCA